MATAKELGIEAVRADTPGLDPRFVAMARDLLLERAHAERGEPVVRPTVTELPPWPDRCPPGCCPNPRGDRPALCGDDEESPA